MADSHSSARESSSDHSRSHGPPSSEKDALPTGTAEATRLYSEKEANGGNDLVLAAADEDCHPNPPQRLGKYSIEERIGHGGMGVVWKAHDPDLNRTVAIKVLAPSLAQSFTSRRRFQREARAAAAISHPHVLTIHAVEEENDTPFLVMEYVSGGSLKAYVASRGKLHPLEVIQFSCQIAQGLAAAHAQGVIHRDVKPGNVMLHEGGMRVRLVDFGLARAAFDNSELTSHDQMLGTPAYMAPEQLCGHRIDARADLFSLGCVMHYMLTGHSPFQRRTKAETIHTILSASPRPLLEIDPSIPPALAEVVDRLLRKDPDERYQSAFEVAAILERYLIQLNQAPTDEIANILARPRLTGRTRRRKTLGAAFAVGLAAVALLLWTMFRPSTISNDHPASDSAVGSGAAPTRSAQELTVARNGEVGFNTLEDALRAARPGDTIRVLDGATYAVNLNLQNRRQLVLEAVAGARLVARNADDHVIQVHGGRDIQIRGFGITTNTADRHAVLLMDCTGVRLENLAVRQEAAQAVAAIHISNCNTSPTATPLEIRGCRIESLHTGQCLWVHADGPAWNVIIENNLLEGMRESTLAVFWGQAGSVHLRNNVFASGNVGFNLNLTPSTHTEVRPSSLQIANNTFFDCHAWIGLVHTDPKATQFVLANNLILNCDSVEASAAQQRAVAEHCTLEGNVWERQALSRGEDQQLQRWARLEPMVPVQSRDPGAAHFLQLPEDSPLGPVGAKRETPAQGHAQP